MDKKRFANILIPSLCAAAVIIPPAAIALSEIDWSHHSGETGDIVVVGEKTQETKGLNSATYTFKFDAEIKPTKIDSIQAINSSTGEIIEDDLLVIEKETYDPSTGEIFIPIRLVNIPLERTEVRFSLLFTYTIDKQTNSSVVNELALDAAPIETKTVNVSLVNQDATIDKTTAETIKPFTAHVTCANRDINGIKEIKVAGHAVDPLLYSINIKANCREADITIQQGVISDDFSIEINYAFMNVSTNIDDLLLLSYAKLCYYNQEFHHTFNYINGMASSRVNDVQITIGGKPIDKNLWEMNLYEDCLTITIFDKELIKGDVQINFDLKKTIVPQVGEYCTISKEAVCYDNAESIFTVHGLVQSGQLEIKTKDTSGNEVTLYLDQDYEYYYNSWENDYYITIYPNRIHSELKVNLVVQESSLSTVTVDDEHKDLFTFVNKITKDSSTYVYLYWKDGEPTQEIYPEVTIGGQTYVPPSGWSSSYNEKTHKLQHYFYIYLEHQYTTQDIYLNFNEFQNLATINLVDTPGSTGTKFTIIGKDLKTNLYNYEYYHYDIKSNNVWIKSGGTTLTKGQDYEITEEYSWYYGTETFISIKGEAIIGDIEIYIPEAPRYDVEFVAGSTFIDDWIDKTRLPATDRYAEEWYYGNYYLADQENGCPYDFYAETPYIIVDGHQQELPSYYWDFYGTISTWWDQDGREYHERYVEISLTSAIEYSSSTVYIDIKHKDGGHDIICDTPTVAFEETRESVPRIFEGEQWEGDFYCNNGLYPGIVVKMGEKQLVEGTDYDYALTSENNAHLVIYNGATDDVHVSFNVPRTISINVESDKYQECFRARNYGFLQGRDLDDNVVSFSSNGTPLTLDDVKSIDVYVGSQQLKIYEYSYSWDSWGPRSGDLRLHISGKFISDNITIKMNLVNFKEIKLDESIEGVTLENPKAYCNDETTIDDPILYYESKIHSAVPLFGTIEICADGKPLVKDKDFTFERYTLDYSYISIAQRIIDSADEIIITKLELTDCVHVYAYGPESYPTFFTPESPVATKGQPYKALCLQDTSRGGSYGDFVSSVKIYIGDPSQGTGRYLNDDEFEAYMDREWKQDLQIIINNGDLITDDIHIYYDIAW